MDEEEKSAEFVASDWNDFRYELREELRWRYANRYRREFFEMLVDDPSSIGALYQMKVRMEERHGLERDHFQVIYLETEKKLEKKARRAFQNATKLGGCLWMGWAKVSASRRQRPWMTIGVRLTPHRLT